MLGSKATAAIGVAIGVILVVSVMGLNHPTWGFFSHEDCSLGERLGNITVWMPAEVVAAPYHGYESGSVTIWGETPQGRSSLSQNTSVGSGNVTAYYVIYANLTVFMRSNVSNPGPGPQSPCTTGMVAEFSPNPAQGLRSGGTTMWQLASSLVSDVNIPNELNGSQLCKEVENSSDGSCAVGAHFDLNFSEGSGTVDTCGSTQGQVLLISSQEWPVTAPFEWNGHSLTVPLDPNGENSANYANGTYAFYNYTFPANGGVWQYDDLAQTSSTGAGLVFSYSPCP
jgi:hypothetical protein